MGETLRLTPVVDVRDEQWPRNPLIAAVVWQLPREGSGFSAEQRAAWLKMMAMAFDVAYGPVESIAGFERGVSELRATIADANAKPLPPAPPRQAHAGHAFYIAADGTACNAAGEPVLMADIPADEMIFDYRQPTGEFRDLDGIRWADGATGTRGIAEGIGFCGPG